MQHSCILQNFEAVPHSLLPQASTLYLAKSRMTCLYDQPSCATHVCISSHCLNTWDHCLDVHWLVPARHSRHDQCTVGLAHLAILAQHELVSLSFLATAWLPRTLTLVVFGLRWKPSLEQANLLGKESRSTAARINQRSNQEFHLASWLLMVLIACRQHC